MADKEYIERDSIYARVKRHTNPYGKPTLDYESGIKVLDMIKQEPAADVVEVVHGEWILCAAYYDGILNTAKCSVCGTHQPIGSWDYYDYCMFCGARMDGERKEHQ